MPHLPVFYSPSYKGNQPAVTCDLPHTHSLPDAEITALHYHACMEFARCIGGEGECVTLHATMRTECGDVQVLMPYEPHLSRSLTSWEPARWQYLYIEPYRLFAEVGLFGAVSTLRTLIGSEIGATPIFRASDSSPAASLVRRIFDLSEREVPYGRERLALTVYELCLTLADTARSDGLAPYPRMGGHDRIAESLAYVREHLGDGEALRIEHLAALSAMSVSAYRVAFRRVTGSSPKKFVLQSRLSYARYLLLRTEKSILEIAMLTGFESLSCFSRAFRSAFSISPLAYRRGGGEAGKEIGVGEKIR